MGKLEQQIHLRNIITCLREIGDYSHYLSYERYLADKELKSIILQNLSLAAQEARNLYNIGYRNNGIQYLAGLYNTPEGEMEDFAIYSLLQNDLDFIADHLNLASKKLAVKEAKRFSKQPA